MDFYALFTNVIAISHRNFTLPSYTKDVNKPDMHERKVSDMSNARYLALVAAAIIAASGTPGTGTIAQKGASPAPGSPEIHAAAAAEVSTAATAAQTDDDDIPPADL